MAKASKATTIASLIRAASKDEPDFIQVTQEVIDTEPLERVAEYFDRLNIPRSVTTDHHLDDMPALKLDRDTVGTWEEEHAIAQGLQKFLDRHERKLKWHSGHPSIEGTLNTLLLVRAIMVVTEHRLQRLIVLLDRHQELTPVEWSIARELMNKAFLGFRNSLTILAGPWVDAMTTTIDPDEFLTTLGNYYEFVDTHIQRLDDYRTKIEERRQDLTVIPDDFPPVKPPNYFGGDLMGRGPWRQFWNHVDTRAHRFREAAG